MRDQISREMSTKEIALKLLKVGFLSVFIFLKLSMITLYTVLLPFYICFVPQRQSIEFYFLMTSEHLLECMCLIDLFLIIL